MKKEILTEKLNPPKGGFEENLFRSEVKVVIFSSVRHKRREGDSNPGDVFRINQIVCPLAANIGNYRGPAVAELPWSFTEKSIHIICPEQDLS